MIFTIIRDNFILPYAVLLLSAGFFLSFRTGFPQLRFSFLGLKILSGTLDQKGAKGKLSPFEAFALGTSSTMVPGVFIGTSLAVQTAGFGVLPWIWLSSIIIMPVHLAASTLSVRFRSVAYDGTLLSGPVSFIEKGLRAKWFGFFYGFLFILASFLLGASFLSGVLIMPVRSTILSPITFSILLSIFVSLLFLGGLRFKGWMGRRLYVIGLLILFPMGVLFRESVGSLPGDREFLKFLEVALSSMMPDSTVELKNLLFALGIYHTVMEAGNGKLSTIAGFVRTDHAAKQGLASMLSPMIGGVIFATLSTYAIFAIPSLRFDGALNLFGSKSGDGPMLLNGILFLSFLFFIPVGIAGWGYAGLQTSKRLGGHTASIIFQIAFILSLLATGLFLQIHSEWMRPVFDLALTLSAFASILMLTGLVLMRKTVTHELERYLNERHLRYEIIKDFYLLILTILPKNLLSRIFGWLSYLHLPRPVMVPLLRAYVRVFKIDVNEAELEIEEYPSLNRFFTRSLKEGMRTVDFSPNAIVSPVDGTVSRFGDIREGRMIQAKGIDYSLEDLLESSCYLHNFSEGKYIVIYLSPRDYHRIHSPHEGKIMGYSYMPGKLFSVNELSVRGLAGLFPKNERLTSYIQTDESGMIGLVKVGAVNVGLIRVNYDTIHTNRWIRIASHRIYGEPFPVGRGDEIGRFEMGSTVILLFEKGSMEFEPGIAEGKTVRFGERIGRFISTRADKKGSRKPAKKKGGIRKRN